MKYCFALIAGLLFFAPTDAFAWCIFNCGGHYDYDGPCPPARAPILDQDPGDYVRECIRRRGCADRRGGLFCRNVSGRCRSEYNRQRQEAADEHMNAQIVCRTAPPPNIHDMCRAKNVCGQEIPLTSSCEYYCDNCYGIDPTGGLDPNKLLDDLANALGDLTGLMSDLYNSIPDFSDMLDLLQDLEEMGKYYAQAKCLAEGYDITDSACVDQKMALIKGECFSSAQAAGQKLLTLSSVIQDGLDTFNNLLNDLENSSWTPPPPDEAISCDGMNWDSQQPSEVIANAVCDNLDNITAGFDPNKFAKDFLENFAKGLMLGGECAGAALDNLLVSGVCLTDPNGAQCQYIKAKKAKLDEKNKKMIDKTGARKKEKLKKMGAFNAVKKLMKSKMLHIKLACAAGKAGNRFIKCFGDPTGITGGIGAKQACQENHFNCSPLLPPGVTRDDFIPRCSSAYE